jgi:hypothetical protein
MSTILKLNCWVFGESLKHILTVKIANMETVGTLKNVIKEAKPVAFHNIDPNSLDLWRVSEPYCWLHSIALS